MSPLVPLPLIQIKRKKNRSLLELSVSLSQNLKNNRRAGAVAQPKGSGLNLQGCTHKMSETQIINMAPRAHFRASLPPLPLAPATPDLWLGHFKNVRETESHSAQNCRVHYLPALHDSQRPFQAAACVKVSPCVRQQLRGPGAAACGTRACRRPLLLCCGAMGAADTLHPSLLHEVEE